VVRLLIATVVREVVPIDDWIRFFITWAVLLSDPRRAKWLGRTEVLTMVVLVGEEKGRVEGRGQGERRGWRDGQEHL
jgi:hypothetical protein